MGEKKIDINKLLERRFTVLLPMLLTGLNVIITLILQEYQLGKNQSASIWRAYTMAAFTLALMFYYPLIPVILKKLNASEYKTEVKNYSLYCVALSEVFYIVIGQSVGGLTMPEFAFSHFGFMFFYIIYSFFHLRGLKKKNSTTSNEKTESHHEEKISSEPKKKGKKKNKKIEIKDFRKDMKKRAQFSLISLIIIFGWVLIPNIFSEPMRVNFEEGLEAGLGEDYMTQIDTKYSQNFGRGNFHYYYYYKRLNFEHERMESLVVYDYGNFQLKMHWFMPIGLEEGEVRPGILSVHGGGFTSGHAHDLDQQALCEWWVSKGYVIGSLEYRLSPDFIFPNAIEDIRRAMVYLKDNALDLHLDTDHFSLFGRSSGATLTILATSEDEWLFNNTGEIEPTEMVDVQSMIAMYPATNFVQLMGETGRFYNILYQYGTYKPYFGVTYKENPELYELASPLNAISSNTPPMLLIGGSLDVLIPKNSHFDPFVEKLNEVGADFISLQIPWANHAFDELISSRSGVLCAYAWERYLGYYNSI